MWTDGNGNFYFGDCRPGDRAATQAEIDAYNAGHAAAAAVATQNATDAAAAENDPDLQALTHFTVAQLDQWVTNNVTNVAGTQRAFKALGRALIILRSQINGS